jgi:hypothetical protein
VVLLLLPALNLALGLQLRRLVQLMVLLWLQGVLLAQQE